MGYSDLGCYGSEIITPNLDRLAWWKDCTGKVWDGKPPKESAE